jgi:serine/threonine-protein kinase ATR
MMAILKTMLNVPELADVTLEVWYTFLTTLSPSDAGPHVGPTSAAFVSCWPHFSENGRRCALKILEYIICDVYRDIGSHMDDVVDLSTIPNLQRLHTKLKSLRRDWSAKEYLQRTVERSSNDNLAVAIQSLSELRSLMLGEHRSLVAELASGDVFDPLVGQILAALLSAACRDGDGSEQLRLLAYECIGVLGAVDPDRCEIKFNDLGIIMLSNFEDEGESVLFALHLIQDVLVGAFRSTSDMSYQSHLAYTIQELLKFCGFTPALVGEGPSGSVPMKIRKRWDRLPKHVIETVAPLLDGHFTLKRKKPSPESIPIIYPTQTTYREWIQLWATNLIGKASGGRAPEIFGVFHSAVRNRDVGVARHLLPHLVLNILISGTDDDLQSICSELLAVLEDQIDPESKSTADKKLLSAQVCHFFHLNSYSSCIWPLGCLHTIGSSKQVGSHHETGHGCEASRDQTGSQFCIIS